MAAAGPGRSSPKGGWAAGGGPGINVFDQLRGQAERWTNEGRRIVIAAWTRGSRERIANLLREHGFKDAAQEDDLAGDPPQSRPGPSRWSFWASNAASSHFGVAHKERLKQLRPTCMC